MRIVLIAVLAAVLCIKAITAAPVSGTICSGISLANITSNGACAYCLVPTNTSLGDKRLRALYLIADNTVGELVKIAKTVSIWISNKAYNNV